MLYPLSYEGLRPHPTYQRRRRSAQASQVLPDSVVGVAGAVPSLVGAHAE